MAALKSKLKTIAIPVIPEPSPAFAETASTAEPVGEIPAMINTVAPVRSANPATISSDVYVAEPVENVFPVAMVERDDSKEVTINEENSATGETTTKVYEMKFKDGEWTARMKWMLTESKLADSLRILADSLSIQHYKLSLLQQQ